MPLCCPREPIEQEPGGIVNVKRPFPRPALVTPLPELRALDTVRQELVGALAAPSCNAPGMATGTTHSVESAPFWP